VVWSSAQVTSSRPAGASLPTASVPHRVEDNASIASLNLEAEDTHSQHPNLDPRPTGGVLAGKTVNGFVLTENREKAHDSTAYR
jgi:hypothetical protein